MVFRVPLAAAGVLLAAACSSDPLAVDAPPDEARPTEETLAATPRSDAGAPVVIVDHFTPRLSLDLTVVSGVSPGKPFHLSLVAVAREAITTGEVSVTSPTLAGMAHSASDGRVRHPLGERLPVIARFTLPPMEAGDRWTQSVPVEGVPEGYYQFAADISTSGPESKLGPYLFDDAYDQTWIMVREEGGAATRAFDPSRFPARTALQPGPFRPHPGHAGGTGDPTLHTAAYRTSGAPSRVHVEVGYVEGTTIQPASGSYIFANTLSEEDPDGTPVRRESSTVPTSGVVSFTCPGDDHFLTGSVTLANTAHVAGATFRSEWYALPSDCGDTVQVTGARHVYLPWRNLRKVIPLVNAKFGHSRSRVRWTTDLGAELSYYDPGADRIVFGLTYDSRWTAAHEYTHALHQESLGGLWPTTRCSYHPVAEVTSYTCAFQEGIASYGGNIGSPTERPHGDWQSVPNPPNRVAAKIERNVAALFHDLLDADSEPGDRTYYPGRYVMTVFKTCRVTRNRISVKRDNVSDFVWCLENGVNSEVHGASFPGLPVPRSVRESATEPSGWSASAIRSTWRRNVG
ncbi:MAG: hypothetical protein OXH08_04185 [Gammaproteobacteria bacterium]|nr:hypothetical protein [Gammaproteobacteria bacterium]MDE0652009.1 hypothetical protein [Gammaproteobacteria bacterium]